jgi:ABC-2 type transport system ATP-binding protein
MNAALESAVPGSRNAQVHSRSSVTSLNDVTKRYSNGVVALDGVSLDLRSGEIVVVLGPNGAGKSTAVKLMMGLTATTSGQVRVFGGDPRFAGNRQRTGVMLQVGRAPDMLRVREHIEIMRGYYPQPLSRAEIVRAAGLEGLENRMFGQLSGGQKQRVLFALSIAGDPDLVFLDEPTVGLDIEARRGMWSQIRSLRARGKTILLTTHYLEEADALADRIIVLNKGKVICEGTPAQVKAAAAGLTARSEFADNGTHNSEASTVKVLKMQSRLSREELLRLPGVERVDGTQTSFAVTSSAPEATLRDLLSLDQSLHGLEVLSPALEDAFLALTAN